MCSGSTYIQSETITVLVYKLRQSLKIFIYYESVFDWGKKIPTQRLGVVVKCSISSEATMIKITSTIKVIAVVGLVM